MTQRTGEDKARVVEVNGFGPPAAALLSEPAFIWVLGTVMGIVGTHC